MLLNIYTDFDDSQIRFKVVFQISESLFQRLNNSQLKNFKKINRDYY